MQEPFFLVNFKSHSIRFCIYFYEFNCSLSLLLPGVIREHLRSHLLMHYLTLTQEHYIYRIYSSLLILVKGIVHFEIKIWYLSAYPKGIQDVGVFFSSVDPILMFLGQTVLVCQSYNGRYRSLSL